jgi:hypothetical protein
MIFGFTRFITMKGPAATSRHSFATRSICAGVPTPWSISRTASLP